MHPTDIYSGLTRERLSELLDIYPESGHFVWRVSRGSMLAGTQAGQPTWAARPYWMIKINRRMYLAHRLMWLYVHGRWPSEIDHINLDKLDNRIENMREVTRSQNIMNNFVRRDNLARMRGVGKRKDGYVARITLNGDRRYLGFFSTPEAAHAAYKAASQELHGEFART